MKTPLNLCMFILTLSIINSCQHHGVRLGITNGEYQRQLTEVRRLELRNNQLTKLSAQISLLTNLELSDNQLTKLPDPREIIFQLSPSLFSDSEVKFLFDQDTKLFSFFLKAVSHNSQCWVERLLKLGQKVDQQDENGNTALHIAALQGNVAIIQILMREGANSTIENEESTMKPMGR